MSVTAMKTLAATLLVFAVSAAAAADHVVVLKHKGFAPDTLRVKVGDAVEFRNEDVVGHEVFAESQAKKFDIETAPGESRKVVFDKTGKVEVGCSLHDGMQLTIKVGN